MPYWGGTRAGRTFNEIVAAGGVELEAVGFVAVLDFANLQTQNNQQRQRYKQNKNNR